MKVTSPFENLSGPGKPFKAELPTPRSSRGSSARDLRGCKDAVNGSLLLESRFDLSYNAAHALGLAALRWSGYRWSPKRKANQSQNPFYDFVRELAPPA